MTAVSPTLIAAYHAAVYEIELADGGRIRTRIDRQSAELDRLMAGLGVTEAAFLTAYNPASMSLCEAENRAAHENLLMALHARRLRYLPARGVDPDGAWPDEPGVFVTGLTRVDAAALARQFDQNGFVYFAAGQPAELVLIR